MADNSQNEIFLETWEYLASKIPIPCFSHLAGCPAAIPSLPGISNNRQIPLNSTIQSKSNYTYTAVYSHNNNYSNQKLTRKLALYHCDRQSLSKIPELPKRWRIKFSIRCVMEYKINIRCLLFIIFVMAQTNITRCR